MRATATLQGRLAVLSPGSLNAVGEPVGYKLFPGENVAAFSRPDLAARPAGGLRLPRPVGDPLRPAQRYPAGDFVNQSPGGGGLPAYIAADRDVDGQDIVVWHTFGPTHLVRNEDWPVMPVTRTGFMLKPTGFFDRNPTLDVPAPGQPLPRGPLIRARLLIRLGPAQHRGLLLQRQDLGAETRVRVKPARQYFPCPARGGRRGRRWRSG